MVLARFCKKRKYSAFNREMDNALEVDDKSKLLSEGPVVKALGSIMIPMAVMMVTSIGFSYIDFWYITRLGRVATNAMDISFPLINLCSAILYGGLGTGVSAAVARRHAKNEKGASETCLKTGFILAIPLSLFFTLGVIFGRGFLFDEAMNEKSEAMAYEYCFWYFLPIVIMALGAVTSSAMRGAGYAKKPAIYSLICMAVNAILTPIFCFESINLGFAEFGIGMGLGMKGAAFSTISAYVLFSILLFKDLFNGSQGFKLFSFSFSPDKEIFKSIFNASAIAALLPMMTNIVILLILRFMNERSSDMVDAFSMAKRFELYMIQLTVCLGAATMIVIGASHATVNPERVKVVLKTSLKYLFLVGVPITIFMAFGSSIYYRSFNANSAIIDEGNSYFIFGSLNMLFTTGLILLNFAFQGIGRPALPIPFTLTSVILIQGIAGWFLLKGGYPSSYYYGLISIGTTITFFLILGVFFRSLNKKE